MGGADADRHLRPLPDGDGSGGPVLRRLGDFPPPVAAVGSAAAAFRGGLGSAAAAAPRRGRSGFAVRRSRLPERTVRRSAGIAGIRRTERQRTEPFPEPAGQHRHAVRKMGRGRSPLPPSRGSGTAQIRSMDESGQLAGAESGPDGRGGRGLPPRIENVSGYCRPPLQLRDFPAAAG
ncbi:hypothetical protein SDC9_199861 [bioreactor metagenome]|uniref:Uncharacterized protein n=1 Tax=bioreactor metagenome TaxID=1076179 RepID=A0A645ILL4_9ZZZZ